MQQNSLLSGALLLSEHEQAIEHADHEEHNLLHNALMRSPEKLKLIDSIITLLNYASNYNQKMLEPLLEIKRCIERDLEVVLSDTSNSVAANAGCCGNRQRNDHQQFANQQQQQQQLARRPLMSVGSVSDGLCIRADSSEMIGTGADGVSSEQASSGAGSGSGSAGDNMDLAAAACVKLNGDQQ